MKNGKATTPWSIPLAQADQLSLGQAIPLHMLWYCVFMCRIQRGDEVPCRLADGEAFTVPKSGGSTGSLVLLSAVGFLTAWRSAMRSGSDVTEQAAASASNFGTL